MPQVDKQQLTLKMAQRIMSEVGRGVACSSSSSALGNLLVLRIYTKYPMMDGEEELKGEE